MPKIYISLSKGKELEGEFTTRERAEADVFVNRYHMGSVAEEEVSEEEFEFLKIQEIREDQDHKNFEEISDLEFYRDYKEDLQNAST